MYFTANVLLDDTGKAFFYYMTSFERKDFKCKSAEYTFCTCEVNTFA